MFFLSLFIIVCLTRWLSFRCRFENWRLQRLSELRLRQHQQRIHREYLQKETDRMLDDAIHKMTEEIHSQIDREIFDLVKITKL